MYTIKQTLYIELCVGFDNLLIWHKTLITQNVRQKKTKSAKYQILHCK